MKILPLLKKVKKNIDYTLKPVINKNYAGIKNLKDIHKNQRAFIIGTGPSLQIRDLDHLVNEVTFSCNKIYLSFSETKWRPTYYSVIDTMVAENNAEKIKNIQLKKIFSNSVKKYFSDSTDVLWHDDLKTEIIDGKRKQEFSQNLLRGTYGGHTVIFTILQIAYYMGIREIYLLGIDFSFTNPRTTTDKTSSGEVLLKNEHEINHFHPDYRKKGELWTMPRLDIMYEAFTVARDIFEKSGGGILNASRKTKLDVFPLVCFDEIFLTKNEIVETE
jgi:hypothetical protein